MLRKALVTITAIVSLMTTTITPAVAHPGSHPAVPQGPAQCTPAYGGYLCVQYKCTHHGCEWDYWYA